MILRKMMEESDAPEECTIKKYYSYQRLIKEKLNHYVNA